jgi:hypothetical protein
VNLPFIAADASGPKHLTEVVTRTSDAGADLIERLSAWSRARTRSYKQIDRVIWSAA